MLKVHLICIDQQNDFCDPNGSLYVKGGDANVGRTAKMIERLGSKLTFITTTLDCHNVHDISHPSWFVDEHGNHPAPFTLITPSDIDSGKWRTSQVGARGRTLEYLKALSATNRYPHVIWPEHCLIGDAGNNLHPTVAGAIHQWERITHRNKSPVSKGSNPWTEHFSAVQAEVPDPMDPSTQVNRGLVEALESADMILWAGEALSHCVANTFRDVIKNFANPEYVKKMTLLTDASSSVPGFENLGDQFVRDMTALGMKTSTTTDILA